MLRMELAYLLGINESSLANWEMREHRSSLRFLRWSWQHAVLMREHLPGILHSINGQQAACSCDHHLTALILQDGADTYRQADIAQTNRSYAKSPCSFHKPR